MPVEFHAANGARHSSENILKSMNELCLEVDSHPNGLLGLREVSDQLRLQPNVKNSFETAELLLDLASAVDSVFDMLRKLHGKGHTEMGPILQEVIDSGMPRSILPLKLMNFFSVYVFLEQPESFKQRRASERNV